MRLFDGTGRLKTELLEPPLEPGLDTGEPTRIGPGVHRPSVQLVPCASVLSLDSVTRARRLLDSDDVRPSDAAKVVDMSESLHVTIVYEQGEDREEARANVIDALRGVLELRFGEHAGVAEAADSEPLELVIGA